MGAAVRSLHQCVAAARAVRFGGGDARRGYQHRFDAQ